jgi:hypothetical protein
LRTLSPTSVLDRPEPSFLTSTCCIGKDFSDENIKQIERIIEGDCFQIKNEGDESCETSVIWHSVYCARISHRCESSESLNFFRRELTFHGVGPLAGLLWCGPGNCGANEDVTFTAYAWSSPTPRSGFVQYPDRHILSNNKIFMPVSQQLNKNLIR